MKTFEPDERFSEFMGHSVPVYVADGERRSSFFPFVVIYCDRLMANIDFALRTLAGRVRHRGCIYAQWSIIKNFIRKMDRASCFGYPEFKNIETSIMTNASKKIFWNFRPVLTTYYTSFGRFWRFQAIFGDLTC